MPKFSYEVFVDDQSESDADLKVKSAIILMAKLKAKEIAKLAHIVQNDPVKTAMAKKALGV